MNQIEELPEPEEVTPADAWAWNVSDSHEALHRDLAARTQAFLSSGGVIEEVAPGATGLKDGLNIFIAHGKADHRVRPYSQRAASEAHHARTLRQEEETVAALARHLDAATSLKDLAKRAGVSPPRAGRFLARHFAEDPRAQQWIPKDRDARRKDYEADAVPRLIQAKADGLIGLRHIATTLGMSYDTVKALNEKHNLQLPRGDVAAKRRYRDQFAEGSL